MFFWYKKLFLISILITIEAHLDFFCDFDEPPIPSLVEFPSLTSTFYTKIRPIKNLLLSNNWTRVYNQTEANLIFSFKSKSIHFESLNLLNPQPLISKVSGSDQLTNKGHLYSNLITFYGKEEVHKFYPESYRMYKQEECTHFFRKLQDETPTVWLKKPLNSSGGQGIGNFCLKYSPISEIFDDPFAQLHKKYGFNTSEDTPECKESKNYLMQSYIKKPLLLKGKKM